MKVSVVIPTRNRPQMIIEALDSLAKQLLPPHEILIVDASDDKLYRTSVSNRFPTLPLQWIDSAASVCVQRNIGIYAASGDWIFLCDDDIIVPENYLSTLVAYINSDPECGAVAGRLMQVEHGEWIDQYRVKGFSDLVWRFVFQLPIWGDLNHVKKTFLNGPLFSWIQNFYRRRGNSFTLGGWPLITDWNQDVFRTCIYSLGANLIRRDWLLKSPYDEVLDRSGIGDNYGVALKFPKPFAIHVLSSTQAYHSRSAQNRLMQPLAYYRRVMALHYFIKRSGKFSFVTSLFFIWSLTGNAIMYGLKRDYITFRATIVAIIRILTNRNPYWEGYKKGSAVMEVKF